MLDQNNVRARQVKQLVEGKLHILLNFLLSLFCDLLFKAQYVSSDLLCFFVLRGTHSDFSPISQVSTKDCSAKQHGANSFIFVCFPEDITSVCF